MQFAASSRELAGRAPASDIAPSNRIAFTERAPARRLEKMAAAIQPKSHIPIPQMECAEKLPFPARTRRRATPISASARSSALVGAPHWSATTPISSRVSPGATWSEEIVPKDYRPRRRGVT